jgi:hypothetical protein
LKWNRYITASDGNALAKVQIDNRLLSRRHAKWAEILLSYDFVIQHLEGKMNPADGPSR